MVLLTQTPAILSALETFHTLHPPSSVGEGTENLSSPLQASPDDPSLIEPALGRPISHGQIIELFQALKDQALKDQASKDPASKEPTVNPVYPHLQELLLGSQVYIPPPTPKLQPSGEYVALMARLRQEAATTEYNRMLVSTTVAPANSSKNPFGKFVAPSNLKAWDIGSGNATSQQSKEEEDEALKEINAQLSLIVNVIVSIVACGCTFFILLGYTSWSNEVKTLASMFGALVVGIAEVVIYVGFIRRVGEAKTMNQKERKRKETRTVEETWVIESKPRDPLSREKLIANSKPSWQREGADTIRQRIGKGK